MIGDSEAVSLVVDAGDELGEVRMGVKGERDGVGGGAAVGGEGYCAVGSGGAIGGGGLAGGGEKELDGSVAGVVTGFVAAEERDVVGF